MFVDPGTIFDIVVLIEETFPFKYPSWVSICFNPEKKEDASSVTFPLRRSSSIIDLAQFIFPILSVII